MKSFLTLLIFIMGLSTQLTAQTPGTISGTVTDNNSEPVIGAVVLAIQNGTTKGGAVSDVDGQFLIKPLQPGRYDVKVNYAGYKESIVKGVIVSPDKETEVNVTLEPSQEAVLNEVTIVEYKVPLIDKFDAGSNVVITAEEIERMPTRNTVSVAGSRSRKGKRRKGTQYIIDGVQVTGANATGGVYLNPGTEQYTKHKENDFKLVSADPLSTMSVDVDRASYSNVRRFINSGQTPPPDAVRIEEMVNYFDYNYPQPQNNDPIAIVTEVTTCPWETDHLLLHIGMQAKKFETEKLPPSNLVFLLDVSGSMDEPNKLPLVKSALKMLVDNLRDKDRIAMVVYAGNAGLVLPSTPGSNKQTIKEAIDQLEAGGSTAGGAGIKLAYKVAFDNYIKGGNNRIILATDGDFNVGISNNNDLERLIEKEREKGIYLTCLGFGMGNYKDSKLEILADKGNGNYAYIDNEKEAQKTLVKEFGGTIFTIAKDVKAQIEFNPAKVQGYRLIGYENRVLSNEDFKDDKKDAGDMGSGHTVTIIYELIPAGVKSKDLPDVDELKYQKKYMDKTGTFTGELATIKFRYKRPNGKTSTEMVHTINDMRTNIMNARSDVQFATSVAMFGMLLQKSAHKGTSDYKKVLELAKKGKEDDKEGYKAEYIRLVKKAGKLNDKEDEHVAGWFAEE